MSFGLQRSKEQSTIGPRHIGPVLSHRKRCAALIRPHVPGLSRATVYRAFYQAAQRNDPMHKWPTYIQQARDRESLPTNTKPPPKLSEECVNAFLDVLHTRLVTVVGNQARYAFPDNAPPHATICNWMYELPFPENTMFAFQRIIFSAIATWLAYKQDTDAGEKIVEKNFPGGALPWQPVRIPRVRHGVATALPPPGGDCKHPK
ncbi:uncharacterized protein EMH_0033710 [Eimeria mitis]|uniref:Uncharacterized protein n=1 Tax=Eimeria mitis TaxID=44415 RepID=U6JVV6_9EIME|nr:uncharacterized protein EMH_0033710 [Eimeria mitis]CDJ27658.1 hypothetical protein EMH_0033710 [Eimeria mitis]